MMGVGSLMSSSRGSGEGGSGVSYPAWLLRPADAVPALDVDFLNDRAWLGAEVSVASALSCSRALAGYYTKADGSLQSFTSNALRYGNNGLLVEPASTNIFARSNELNHAAWTLRFNATASADSSLAPDGAAGVNRVVSGGGTAYFGNAITTSATTHTLSGYIKSNTGGTQLFRLYGNSGGSLSSDFTATTSWQRFSHTFTASASANHGIVSAFGGSVFDLLVFGMQIEVGSVATSYIPTTSASVTRPVDVVTFSDLTWFSGTGDSLYAEWIARNVADATVWAIDATNDVLLDEQTGMSPRVSDAGATFAATVANTASAGATVKAAARIGGNDVGVCMNGGTVATDTSATQPGTIAASRLGLRLAGSNALGGYIRRVAAFKSVMLANASLQSLTT